MARVERSSRARTLLPTAGVFLIGALWLNQGVGLARWKAEKDTSSAIAAPFQFLYRRAPDEEMYFATASATLGKPYDPKVFAIRGESPLPAVDVPADGRVHVPYADVPFEYPPPNVPFVVTPRLFADTFEGYARVFGLIMAAVLTAAAVLAARLGTDDDRERTQRLLAFGALLLAHGAIAVQRLDALVALLLVLVVRAGLRRDDRMLGFWSGLVGATKVVPFVVGAGVLAATKPTRERVLRFAAGGAVGLALGLLPMVLLAPSSVAMFLRYHGARGLNVESTLGVVYGAIVRERGILDYGSFNFHGGVADALAKLATVLFVVLLAVVLRQTYRSRVDEPLRVVLAAIGATLAAWLGGKVFSPQYLTWMLPLVVALPGPAWKRATLALGGVLLLSQLYYRGWFDHVYLQKPLGIVTMVLRLGLISAFFHGVLRALDPVLPPREEEPSR